MKLIKILFINLIFIGFSFFPKTIWAAKVRSIRGGTATKTVGITSRGIKSSVKFRSDRHGLIINFTDFTNITSVSYTLTYTSNGVPQGAMGTVTAETADQQREVLFGTCSSGTCRWHENLQDTRLFIESKLKSDVTVRKPYRIKV